MLNVLKKSNQWIVLAAIAVATTALIGCNKGGGGGGGPAINCLQPQNFNNQTCLNARRGNLNNPYGRPQLSAGGYTGSLPADGDGVAIIANPNLAFMSALCSGSNNARGTRGTPAVRRSGWADDGGAYYQDAGYYMNDICLNVGTVVLTFSTEKIARRQYWIGWKLYFVPIGIPVPAGAPIEQIRAWSRDTSTAQFNDKSVRLGPNGFGTRSPEGVGLDFTKNGDNFSVIVQGPRGPVGSGTMTFQGF